MNWLLKWSKCVYSFYLFIKVVTKAIRPSCNVKFIMKNSHPPVSFPIAKTLSPKAAAFHYFNCFSWYLSSLSCCCFIYLFFLKQLIYMCLSLPPSQTPNFMIPHLWLNHSVISICVIYSRDTSHTLIIFWFLCKLFVFCVVRSNYHLFSLFSGKLFFKTTSLLDVLNFWSSLGFLLCWVSTYCHPENFFHLSVMLKFLLEFLFL